MIAPQGHTVNDARGGIVEEYTATCVDVPSRSVVRCLAGAVHRAPISVLTRTLGCAPLELDVSIMCGTTPWAQSPRLHRSRGPAASKAP